MDTERVVRQKWHLLNATMDERVRRLWAGTEADAIGHGGVAAVSRATGMAISTVRKGRDEARAGARRDDVVRVRRSSGKRPYAIAHPEVWPALENLVDPVTRGDPESPLRWTCKSTQTLSVELAARHGIRISDKTVAKLLREHGYSLQAASPFKVPSLAILPATAPSTRELRQQTVSAWALVFSVHGGDAYTWEAGRARTT